MSQNSYQEALTLLQNSPSETTKIFRAISNLQHGKTFTNPRSVKRLMSLTFQNEDFAKHIPTNNEMLASIELLLKKAPEARRELAANPSAPFEVLKLLADYDADYGVILALKEQVARREDLKGLKIVGDHIKTNQEDLQKIADQLNEVSKGIHVPIKDIKILDERSLGIEKEMLHIYLSDSKQKEDFLGWIYHERVYELTEPYSDYANRDDHDNFDEEEIGVFSSISEVVVETIATCSRLSAKRYIEHQGESAWLKRNEDHKVDIEEDRGMGML